MPAHESGRGSGLVVFGDLFSNDLVVAFSVLGVDLFVINDQVYPATFVATKQDAVVYIFSLDLLVDIGDFEQFPIGFDIRQNTGRIPRGTPSTARR